MIVSALYATALQKIADRAKAPIVLMNWLSRDDHPTVKSKFLLCWFLAGVLYGQVSGPVILHSSKSAVAGDIIYLQGSQFGSTPYVQYSYNDSNWQFAKIVSAFSGYVSIQIPATETRLPDLLTVRISPDNTTWSTPVYVNRTDGMSVDSDQIAPGGTLRIFGRNLRFEKTPTVRFFDQTTNLSYYGAVVSFASSQFRLTVTVPSEVVAGDIYSVYVSNGYVGNGTTGGETLVPQSVTGRTVGTDYWNLGVVWAADLTMYTNVYNVETDDRLSVHAEGNGVTDDTAALRAAVSAAGSAGGGTVYLPLGSYVLKFSKGCGLTLPSNVVVMGAGRALTNLNYGYGSAPPSDTGYAICFANRTGVSDLTLNNVDESGAWQQSGLSMNQNEVFLQRVTWNLSGSQWLVFQSMHYLTIQNSTITQQVNNPNLLGPLNIQSCSYCELRGNTISFVLGGMDFDGASNIVFENNVVNRDVSTSPPPASVTHSISASFVSSFTVLNNQFNSEGGAVATNNDGEVINSEGGGPNRFDEFRGTVTASDSTSLTDLAQNFTTSSNYVPALRPGIAKVAIVSGPGMGQVRSVTAVSSDGTTLMIDSPWDIAVTAGSNYATFDWSANNWIIANNLLTGNFKGIEFFNASASDVLIESNVLTNSDGIMISPSQNPPGLFNVIYGLEILGNVVQDLNGLKPAYVGIIPREDQQSNSFGTAVLGATLKNNAVTGFTPNVFVNQPSWDDYLIVSEGFLNYWVWQSTPGYSPNGEPAPILGTVFQHNQATNSKDAFVLNTGSIETVIQDYSLTNTTRLLLDSAIAGSTQASLGTVIADLVRFVFVSPLSTTELTSPLRHPRKGQN